MILCFLIQKSSILRQFLKVKTKASDLVLWPSTTWLPTRVYKSYLSCPYLQIERFLLVRYFQNFRPNEPVDFQSIPEHRNSCRRHANHYVDQFSILTIKNNQTFQLPLPDCLTRNDYIILFNSTVKWPQNTETLRCCMDRQILSFVAIAHHLCCNAG